MDTNYTEAGHAKVTHLYGNLLNPGKNLVEK